MYQLIYLYKHNDHYTAQILGTFKTKKAGCKALIRKAMTLRAIGLRNVEVDDNYTRVIVNQGLGSRNVYILGKKHTAATNLNNVCDVCL